MAHYPALMLINKKAASDKSFSLEDLEAEILAENGPFRVAQGISLRHYLGELIGLGILSYSYDNNNAQEVFSPTGAFNTPEKWNNPKGENPFITASHQDFG